jgi:hypothetical protein
VIDCCILGLMFSANLRLDPSISAYILVDAPKPIIRLICDSADLKNKLMGVMVYF